MLKIVTWQKWLAVIALAGMMAVPGVAFARSRGQNIPFVITAMGPIRKSDYYAHLMTPEQRAAQRKAEDAYVEKMQKAQQGKSNTKPSTSTTTKKK